MAKSIYVTELQSQIHILLDKAEDYTASNNFPALASTYAEIALIMSLILHTTESNAVENEE